MVMTDRVAADPGDASAAPGPAVAALSDGVAVPAATPRLASAAAARDDSSLMSEVTPSGLASGFGDGHPSAPVAAPRAARPLPLIGGRPAAQQQRILVAAIVSGLLLLVVVLFGVSGPGLDAGEGPAAAAQAQARAERLAVAARQALDGSPSAAEDLRQAARGLASGLASLPAGAPLGQAAEIGRRLDAQALALAGHDKAIARAAQARRAIDGLGDEMLATAQALLVRRLEGGAPAAEASAAAAVAVLAQRLARQAAEVTAPAAPPDAAAQDLARDLAALRTQVDALEGATATRDAAAADAVKTLRQQHAGLREQVLALLEQLPSLAAARQSAQALSTDVASLRSALDGAAATLPAGRGLAPSLVLAGAVLALVLVASGVFGMLQLFVFEQVRRSREAEAQRAEAERQEREAKRVNDANQMAILRLMNELQSVAEGDLTQQATVTEDITGAIADSVNYTVEELRSLVSQVQRVAQRVARTTQQVELTSSRLLGLSTEQLREIRETGEAVLRMASRINEVSSQAQRSAEVARQSLQVSATGQHAVQDTIGGMNAIRDQIQETAKRIKRLGESSQEIGEITDLISDITEQTNVLALNAAIQAASAGEAGRGFSVVAEEVQRLAERSADATRQISALVRAIQTDTLDAVAAMERSTVGVVEGARLTDAAGTALNDIDLVTRELASLIERISAQALREAESASVVASSIQHIFAVTEQTSAGTQSTAETVRELSRTAEELRASVARFKVG